MDTTCRLVAIHHGHLNVHEDHVPILCPRFLDPLNCHESVVHHLKMRAFHHQEFAQNNLVDLAVLCRQDADTLEVGATDDPAL